jgi:hypothetical protein
VIYVTLRCDRVHNPRLGDERSWQAANQETAHHSGREKVLGAVSHGTAVDRATQPIREVHRQAFLWFLVGTILNAVFFFAKAAAHGQHDLIMRIALIDGPLRDIQLLGFAALIIAGVSQRFVPQVYGLARPARDRQTLIFWLMNGSLVLNVLSYACCCSRPAGSISPSAWNWLIC